MGTRAAESTGQRLASKLSRGVNHNGLLLPWLSVSLSGVQLLLKNKHDGFRIPEHGGVQSPV